MKWIISYLELDSIYSEAQVAYVIYQSYNNQCIPGVTLYIGKVRDHVGINVSVIFLSTHFAHVRRTGYCTPEDYIFNFLV